MQGLFRIAGGAAKLKKFRALAGAGVMDLLSYDAHEDVHAVAGTLKHYLRELPDPLLTQDLYNEWVAVTRFGKLACVIEFSQLDITLCFTALQIMMIKCVTYGLSLIGYQKKIRPI